MNTIEKDIKATYIYIHTRTHKEELYTMDEAGPMEMLVLCWMQLLTRIVTHLWYNTLKSYTNKLVGNMEYEGLTVVKAYFDNTEVKHNVYLV